MNEQYAIWLDAKSDGSSNGRWIAEIFNSKEDAEAVANYVRQIHTWNSYQVRPVYPNETLWDSSLFINSMAPSSVQSILVKVKLK